MPPPGPAPPLVSAAASHASSEGLQEFTLPRTRGAQTKRGPEGAPRPRAGSKPKHRQSGPRRQPSGLKDKTCNKYKEVKCEDEKRTNLAHGHSLGAAPKSARRVGPSPQGWALGVKLTHRAAALCHPPCASREHGFSIFKAVRHVRGLYKLPVPELLPWSCSQLDCLRNSPRMKARTEGVKTQRHHCQRPPRAKSGCSASVT